MALRKHAGYVLFYLNDIWIGLEMTTNNESIKTGMQGYSMDNTDSN